MPNYGRGCLISTLITVPINFWRNSDLFKKKEPFSSSKIDQVRAFLSNFPKKISQIHIIYLSTVI